MTASTRSSARQVAVKGRSSRYRGFAACHPRRGAFAAPPIRRDGSWRRQAMGDPAQLRISDGDRQEFVEQLTRHCAEGRLTFEELDERVASAWSARTQA